MRLLFLYSGLKGISKLLIEKKVGVIGLVYLFFSVYILYRYGIDTNGEAVKYLEDARQILNGGKLRIEFFSVFYIVYSLFISFFIHFSLSLQGAALVQILFCFIAGCCVF